MRIKEYESERKGDVVNDSRNGEKDDQKGKRVGTRAGHEYSGDMAERGKSRNSTGFAVNRSGRSH